MLAILVHCPDRGYWQISPIPEIGELSRLEPRKENPGYTPDDAGMVPANRGDGIVRKPVFGFVSREAVIAVASQSFCGADPEAAVGACRKCRNRIARQSTVFF